MIKHSRTYSRSPWLPIEERFVRSCLNTMPWCFCLEVLPRTKSSIYYTVNRLGLKHSKAFIGEMTRRNWKKGLHENSKRNFFKAGNIPMNKGKKQTEYMSPEAIERTSHTRFKKGDRPSNWRPVGSTRITKDGYIEIKTEEPNSWFFQHRLVWINTHGEIKPGVNIQFIDKNRLNISIDNLFAIERSEQMQLNIIHRYPNEVKALIRLQAKLSKTIQNKLSNEK